MSFCWSEGSAMSPGGFYTKTPWKTSEDDIGNRQDPAPVWTQCPSDPTSAPPQAFRKPRKLRAKQWENTAGAQGGYEASGESFWFWWEFYFWSLEAVLCCKPRHMAKLRTCHKICCWCPCFAQCVHYLEPQIGCFATGPASLCIAAGGCSPTMAKKWLCDHDSP